MFIIDHTIFQLIVLSVEESKNLKEAVEKGDVKKFKECLAVSTHDVFDDRWMLNVSSRLLDLRIQHT